MKMNTLEKVYSSLRDLAPRIEMAPELIARARLPIERMLDLLAETRGRATTAGRRSEGESLPSRDLERAGSRALSGGEPGGRGSGGRAGRPAWARDDGRRGAPRPPPPS